MSDEDSPLETTAIRARRHLLPSVSEVVRQLSADHPEADPGLVYRAAREICRRELDRVKEGRDPAPVSVLVQRAAHLMKSPTLLEETAGPASVTMSPFGSGAFRPLRPTPLPASPAPLAPPAPPVAAESAGAPPFPPDPAASASGAAAPRADEPFGETMGALDLSWAEAKGAPFDAPPPSFPPEGPGEETLRRLDEEAAAVPLDSLSSPTIVLPAEPAPLFPPAPGGPAAGPEISPLFPPVDSFPAAAGTASPPEAFPGERPVGGLPEPFGAAVEPTRRSSLAPFASVLVLVAVAGAGWLYFRRSGPVGPAPQGASARGKATATSPAAPSALPSAPPALPAAPSATSATSAPASPRTPPVLAAAPPVAASAPAAPLASPSASPAPRVVALAGSGPIRAGSFESADWKGPDAFVVHFSSYRERATAEKDAARIGKGLDQPTRVVSIDLGEKGTWNRVVAGEFATLEQALAYRKTLEEAATPGLGFVYRVKSK